MTVERLVQEIGLERADIFIVASGSQNSAGELSDGADTRSAATPSPDRQDVPLGGVITLSVDIANDAKAAQVRRAFAEFDADAVSQS